MTSPRPAPPNPPPGGAFANLLAYFTTRVDPLTSLFLVIPLFVVYQLGTLALMDCDAAGRCSWTANGVDFLTGNLLALTRGSRLAYAAIALGASLAIVIGIIVSRRGRTLSTKLFIPVIAESVVLASAVGPTAVFLSRSLGLGALHDGSWISGVVTSCGAGLHEELIFRAGLFAGLVWLLRRAGQPSWRAYLVSGLLSSIAFSGVHHLGPLGDPFTLQKFMFRMIMGLFFAGIYRVRGFAIAAWTHCVYDVWVLVLL